MGKADMGKARGARQESLEDEVQSALKWLKSNSTKATLDGMARYAIPSNNAFGVAYRDMKLLGKRLGRNHELAAALWDTGVYEARMVASFVDDPSRVTPEQMDHWCKDFDNWGICDTMCFNLFDRTPQPGPRSRSGARARTSSSSARHLHCFGVSAYMISAQATRRSSRASFSSSARLTTNGTSSRRL